MNQVPERDWKILAGSKELYLNRLCARFNAEASAILRDPAGDDYSRYLKVYKHIKEADEVVARLFDDWKRSRFHRILATLIELQVTGPELGGVSEETREVMHQCYKIDLDFWDCPF